MGASTVGMDTNKVWPLNPGNVSTTVSLLTKTIGEDLKTATIPHVPILH
jgi:hypothetical protein